MSRITARLRAMPVATTACNTRKVRNQPMDGAKIAPNVAITKARSAAMITGLRPKRSDTGPISSCSAALPAR